MSEARTYARLACEAEEQRRGLAPGTLPRSNRTCDRSPVLEVSHAPGASAVVHLVPGPVKAPLGAFPADTHFVRPAEPVVSREVLMLPARDPELIPGIRHDAGQRRFAAWVFGGSVLIGGAPFLVDALQHPFGQAILAYGGVALLVYALMCVFAGRDPEGDR